MNRATTHHSRLLALVATGVLAVAFAACGDGDDDPTATTTPPPGVADPAPGVVMLVPNHGVEDFDHWKPIFVEHREVRAQYGGSRDLVYRDVEDPNNLTIYMTYPGTADAEAFYVDESLAEAMDRAGVLPPFPPPYEFLRELEVLDYVNPGSGVAGDELDSVLLVIRHQVDDYEAWKPVFDEVEELRREHGATGHRLYAAFDDPNDILAYESYPTEEQALAFFNDERLRDAMARAGVQEDSMRWWLRTLDEHTDY